MNRFRRFGWMAGLALLAGCGTSDLFGTYDLPESDAVATAEYPRLIDTPLPPPQGSYGPGFPDPATGVAITTDLGAASQAASTRAERLSEPVLSDAELRRLGRTR